MNGIRPTIFVVQFFFSRKENLIVTLVIHSYIIRTSNKVPREEVPENHKTIVIDNDSN